MSRPTDDRDTSATLPDWARASRAAQDALQALPQATVQKVGKNRTLLIAADATDVIYFVVEGWLISSKSTHDGRRQIIDFVLPGEMFDPGSACPGQASTDLVALTDATLSIVPRDVWASLLDDHPDLKRSQDRHHAAGYSRIAERLLRIGQSGAQARVAYAICELCLRSSDLGLKDGTVFHVPMNQLVLADFVGLSSVHVNRTLRRLTRQEVISTGDHMDILIHDVDRLAEIAEVDLDTLKAEIIPGD